MGRLEEIRAELDAGHPVTGAYSAIPAFAANEMNEPNQTLPQDRLTAEGVRAVVDPAEYAALGNNERRECLQVLGFNIIDLTTLDFSVLEGLFGDPSVTRTALIALRDQLVGRGEFLGLGFIKPGDIQQARNL